VINWRFLTCVCVALLAAGCGDDSPTTSPTDTTTTTTVAEPAVTEQFDGVVPVGGSTFYSFTTSTYGTITVTLTAVGGNYVPSTVMLDVGLGQPSGTDCSTTTTVTTAAGTTVQVTGNYDAAVYCAKVSDIGNLFAPASISVSIAYP
jgi:hypothetical protein